VKAKNHTNTPLRSGAAGRPLAFARLLAVVIGPSLAALPADAAMLYTFSNGGANPYSFSFLEPNSLFATGAFAIAPFQEGGLTFTQATLTQSGGTACFQFGTPGATLTATPFSCGLSAVGSEGGWQSLFLGATAPGTYTAFNAVSDGSAPAAPDRLTIQNVAAFEYTFSNTGANPYSFSFLELGPLVATRPFAIAPFQQGGLTFTQATLTQSGGTACFQFGTAGVAERDAFLLRPERLRSRRRLAEPVPRRHGARQLHRVQRGFRRQRARRAGSPDHRRRLRTARAGASRRRGGAAGGAAAAAAAPQRVSRRGRRRGPPVILR